MNVGDVVVYQPVNWVNGKPKTDHPFYGKTAFIRTVCSAGLLDHQLLWLDFGDGKLHYATSKEVKMM